MARTDADREVERVLSSYTRLRALRREYSLLLKLIDTAVFCRAPRFIVIDSDIIFLENPVELISGCPSPGEGLTGSHYMSPHYISRDQESRYTVDTGVAAGSGWHLPSRINSGLINCSKEHLDFAVMEDFLQSLDVGLHLPDCWYIEQTLWALECGRSGFTFLPDTYCLANGPGLQGFKVKHYVGANIDRLRNSRDYFYTEGIPAVRRDAAIGRRTALSLRIASLRNTSLLIYAGNFARWVGSRPFYTSLCWAFPSMAFHRGSCAGALTERSWQNFSDAVLTSAGRLGAGAAAGTGQNVYW